MDLASVTIEPLDQAAMARLAGALAALDAEARRDLGVAYSHEEWSAEHFAREVSGKWDISRVALIGGKPCGFWIASHAKAEAHTHRVLMARSARGAGAGRILWEVVAAAARQQGCSSMTLTLNKLNGDAARFYRRLGFKRLRAGELLEFVRRRGRSGMVVGDEINERHDRGLDVYHGFWLDLENA